MESDFLFKERITTERKMFLCGKKKVAGWKGQQSDLIADRPLAKKDKDGSDEVE